MRKPYKEILESIRSEVRKQLPEIEANGEWLWNHPETGFKEVETQKYCLEVLKKHGYEATTWSDVTGFTCVYDTGRPGPTVMLMGEMDSLICNSHPDCNPETGAAHACGHAVQSAVCMGAFFALTESGVLENYGGKVILSGVPAEECVEVEWRMQEIKKGRIHFLSGKSELMYRGAFEGVDVAISMHAGYENDGTISLLGIHNGSISKTVKFYGKSAHAAADPENGVNALYMATTAINTVNALRETFRDEDRVRVNSIITKGGTVVNAIPEEVCVEAQCRASNIDAMLNVAEKFNRAMEAGATAFGGKVEISTQPGYMPYRPVDELKEIAAMVADDILGEGHCNDRGYNCGSTDLGDLNEVIPGIQVFMNYTHGNHHAADYGIADKRIYETSSVYLAAFVCRLLEDEGALTKKVKESHRPLFQSTKEYCDYVTKMFSTKVLS